MLPSEPLWAVFGYNVLDSILTKLYNKVAYLSAFGIKFILSEDKGAVTGSSAFGFEILGVERALRIHYQLCVGGVAGEAQL